MKKVTYAAILLLVVAGGLVFAKWESKKETAKKPVSRPLTAAEREAGLKAWEATPAGIAFKKWEVSPEGKNVLAGADKISKEVNTAAKMEAIVTSLSLPPGSRLGFGIMTKINGEEYILSFGPEKDNEFQQLHSLRVNDKIMIRCHSVSYAPKYAYPIVSCDYVERNNIIMYKRAPRKDGC